MNQRAEFVTVWDSGNIEIRTECKIDLSQTPPFVSDIGSADADDVDLLDSTYVELPSEIISTFSTDEGEDYQNGQLVEVIE